jgi:hypothetical protein
MANELTVSAYPHHYSGHVEIKMTATIYISTSRFSPNYPDHGSFVCVFFKLYQFAIGIEIRLNDLVLSHITQHVQKPLE